MDRASVMEAALAEYSRLKSGDKFWSSLSDTWKQTSMSANRAEFERALAAIEAAGWVVVPRVPTEAMKLAGGMVPDAFVGTSAARGNVERIYRAMLAADAK